MAGLLRRLLNFRRKPKMKPKGKDFLKNVVLFSDLSEDELSIVWSIVKEVQIIKGDIIINEGDIGDSMYFFADGKANVTKNLTLKLNKSSFGQVDKSMITLDSNFVSFFGDMAMFEEEPRSATILATSDCLLYEMKKNDFIKLCIDYPAMGIKLLTRIAKTLCARIRKSNQDILKLSTALSIALSK
jgi:CRP/FNR family transcriptional regulator, cyclic AMP receptor protein